MVEGIEGVDWVRAPHAIHDPALERNVYGSQDRVPMADAIKYGLVPAPPAPTEPSTEPKRGRRARRPAEDREKKGPAEDR